MKIAILSNGTGNYSTKRLKEEAELRGHEVKVVKYKDCYVSIEPNKNLVYYKGKPLQHFDAIIPRIASHMTNYGCMIVRQLEMQGEYTLSRSLAITRAREATYLIANSKNLDAVAREERYRYSKNRGVTRLWRYRPTTRPARWRASHHQAS